MTGRLIRYDKGEAARSVIASLTDAAFHHPPISLAVEVELHIYGLASEAQHLGELLNEGASLNEADKDDLRDIRDRISKLIGDAR